MKIMTKILMLMVVTNAKHSHRSFAARKRNPKMWKHFEEGMRATLPILHLKLKVLIEKRKKNIELEFMRQLLDCTILTLSEISSSFAVIDSYKKVFPEPI